MDDGGIGVWGNVITGAITATATLLGVWLAQWHARKMRRLDQHDELRAEQRGALAEVLEHLKNHGSQVRSAARVIAPA